MHYKKEHFILLLKDLVKYLSLVYCKGDFFEINLLNTNNLSLNVERPYIINNQHTLKSTFALLDDQQMLFNGIDGKFFFKNNLIKRMIQLFFDLFLYYSLVL